MTPGLSPKNILARGTNWVGDAVMTLPAVSALAGNFPESRLTVLTRPWAAAVYEHSPVVAEVLRHDRDGAHKGFFGRLRLALELRSKNYDLALLFQNAFEAALTGALARIPERWGYARDGRSFLLTRAIELQEEDRYIHESFYYLNILKRCGLKAPFSLPRLFPQAGAEAKAAAALKAAGVREGEFLLALAPGAAFGSAKRWPMENFARASRLVLRETQGRALILGGSGESEIAALLAGLLGEQALNMTGCFSLDISLALLQRCGLLLTNDSGLMHLGGALGVPLAAAFGPTNPLTTSPLGRARMVRSQAACSPCLKRECPLPRRICFDDVEPEKVAGAALGLVNQKYAKNGKSPAVFLDRDGTINVDVDFLSDPSQLKLIDGAAEAVAGLNRAGFKVVVVTNQSGLARGFFTMEDLERIHGRLQAMLAEKGARVDAFYFCPHHPEGKVPELSVECACRKPGLGLFEQAIEELNINPAISFWVGDRMRDLAPAEKWGGSSALVLTGYGLTEVKKGLKGQPSLVAPDLAGAAEWIIARSEAELEPPPESLRK